VENFDADEESGKKDEDEAEEETVVSGLDALKISARVKNTLLSAGISTPEALSEKSAEDLKSVEGIGDKAITEIKKAMIKAGFLLKEE